MGRRAKNKQGDPESLREPKEHISPKKLGKRKANPGSDQKRPTKKVKDPARPIQRPTRSESLQENVKPRRTGKAEWSDDSSESWGGIEEDNRDEGSEGWDDVQDEDAVPVQSRYVISCSSRTTSHRFIW